MKENTKREPTFYIVGNPERKDEIKHIIEVEWGGINKEGINYGTYNDAYFVGLFGFASSCNLENIYFKEALKNGLMKEYKLPEKPQFKPFDKVVVKCKGCSWKPLLFGYKDNEDYWLIGYGYAPVDKTFILPYNEETAKLIGTSDNWEGCV